MLGVEARAGFRVARRNSGDARAPRRARRAFPRTRAAVRFRAETLGWRYSKASYTWDVPSKALG